MKYLWIAVFLTGCAAYNPGDYSHLPKDECIEECRVDYRFCRQIGVNEWRCYKELQDCQSECK